MLLVDFVVIILDPNFTWKIIVLIKVFHDITLISLLHLYYISSKIAKVQLLPQGPQGRVALCRLLKPAIATMEPTSTISHDRSTICCIQYFHGLSICCQFYIILSMFYQFFHPLFPWVIHGFFSEDLLFFFPLLRKKPIRRGPIGQEHLRAESHHTAQFPLEVLGILQCA